MSTALEDPASPALRELNPAQREAVAAPDGPVLVVAGAGSGKTRVLIHRIAHLLETGRARPGEILAITFTNRAAAEMRERVSSLAGAASRAMWVMTFHSACARMLRSGAERLGYSRAFTIYDEADSLRMIKRCMEEAGADPKRFPPRAVRSQISAAKSALLDSESYARDRASHFEEVAGEVYSLYERRMVAANAMDFDDLLARMVDLIEIDPGTRERWQRAFGQVLVDEYQDTNHAQYRLLQLLCERHRNLFVVGDEDQSIYAFRHADIRNILDFERDFPEATVVKLEQNYRSTQTILSAANAVVSRNRERRPKRLWSEAGQGEPVELAEHADEHEEARWVAAEIDRLGDEEGLRRDRVAVFYRVNAMSRVLEDVLERDGTPYRVVGGTRFYERAEVKDALSYLALAVNPADSISFSRIVNVPRRGIGKTTQARLLAHANTTGQSISEVLEAPEAVSGLGAAAVKSVRRFAEVMAELREGARAGGPVAPLLERTIDLTGYAEALEAERTIEAEGRLENLQELVGLAAERDAERDAAGGTDTLASDDEGDAPEAETLPVEDLLQQVSLHSQQDEMAAGQDTVTLMTLHNAKGLEFDAVFMIGCEDGVFPHSRALDEGQEEEERRLCYVGLTRARTRLALSWARTRRAYGGRPEVGWPSRFIEELPPELVSRREPPRWSGVAGRSATGLAGVRWNRGEAWPRDAPARPGAASGDPGASPAAATVEFSAGEEVVHSSFGAGTVTGVEPGGIVVVRFDRDGGERKLMAGYAPLERRAEAA